MLKIPFTASGIIAALVFSPIAAFAQIQEVTTDVEFEVELDVTVSLESVSKTIRTQRMGNNYSNPEDYFPPVGALESFDTTITVAVKNPVVELTESTLVPGENNYEARNELDVSSLILNNAPAIRDLVPLYFSGINQNQVRALLGLPSIESYSHAKSSAHSWIRSFPIPEDNPLGDSFQNFTIYTETWYANSSEAANSDGYDTDAHYQEAINLSAYTGIRPADVLTDSQAFFDHHLKGSIDNHDSGVFATGKVQLSAGLWVRSGEGDFGVAGYLINFDVEVEDVRLTILNNEPSKPATCYFKKFSEWSTGFVGAVYIKNNTDQPIEGWNIDLEFEDPITMTGFWSAVFSGQTPLFNATPLSWNQKIWPGQEINFGVQGTKTPEQTGNASVTGDICE